MRLIVHLYIIEDNQVCAAIRLAHKKEMAIGVIHNADLRILAICHLLSAVT